MGGWQRDRVAPERLWMEARPRRARGEVTLSFELVRPDDKRP